MKNATTATKIIADTTIAGIMAAIIELIMYAHQGVALTSGAVLGRVAIVIGIVILVIIFTGLRVRLSSYFTILGNLYLGVLCLGGLLQAASRASAAGIATEVVAIAGVVVAVAGIIQGIKQRLNYPLEHMEGK